MPKKKKKTKDHDRLRMVLYSPVVVLLLKCVLAVIEYLTRG